MARSGLLRRFPLKSPQGDRTVLPLAEAFVLIVGAGICLLAPLGYRSLGFLVAVPTWGVLCTLVLLRGIEARLRLSVQVLEQRQKRRYRTAMPPLETAVYYSFIVSVVFAVILAVLGLQAYGALYAVALAGGALALAALGRIARLLMRLAAHVQHDQER